MAFHVLAYTGSISLGTDIDVAALSDPIIQIQNNHFIFPSKMNLLGSMLFSPSLVRCRLVAPTLRQICTVFVRGINQSAIAVNNGFFYFIFGGGTALQPFEEHQLLATITAAGPERFTGLLFVGDQPQPIPQGNVYPLRFTSVTAAVANAWTLITYTTTDVIPAGVYTMIQSELQSANAIAHRWTFSNQLWRPGYPGIPNTFNRLPDQLLVQQFGVMGTFRSNDLPRLEVLANAADASHEGYMWIQRTGNLV